MDELFPNFMQPKTNGKKCRHCDHACRVSYLHSYYVKFVCEIQEAKNFFGLKYIKLKNDACYFFKPKA
jgi:hypothetical protein